MFKKILLILFILVGLSACAQSSSATETPTLDATLLFKTAVYQLTGEVSATDTPAPTQTLAIVYTSTPVPTIDRTRPLIQSPTAEAPCDQASAGLPFDVTIPDGTVMSPGESFTKTWRLVNAGSCTWTRQYALTFFSGASLNALYTHFLAQEVAPGGVIDLSVDMEAPLKAGIYQSNWMLSNVNGELFGIGPNGDAPFWAKIEVMDLITDTPQPTPTVTNTPVVYLTGEVELSNGDQLDLDTGTLNPDNAAKPDLVYQYGGDPTHILTTMNGMVWTVFGEDEPSFVECVDSEMIGNAISSNEVPLGTYICYRTSGMLPGRLLLEGFEEGVLSIRFVTWAVP